MRIDNKAEVSICNQNLKCPTRKYHDRLLNTDRENKYLFVLKNCHTVVILHNIDQHPKSKCKIDLENYDLKEKLEIVEERNFMESSQNFKKLQTQVVDFCSGGGTLILVCTLKGMVFVLDFDNKNENKMNSTDKLKLESKKRVVMQKNEEICSCNWSIDSDIVVINTMKNNDSTKNAGQIVLYKYTPERGLMKHDSFNFIDSLLSSIDYSFIQSVCFCGEDSKNLTVVCYPHEGGSYLPTFQVDNTTLNFKGEQIMEGYHSEKVITSIKDDLGFIWSIDSSGEIRCLNSTAKILDSRAVKQIQF